MAPAPPSARTSASWSSIYNPSLDHYFITAEPAEAAMLDAGVIVPGWPRTGFAFKVRPRRRRARARRCRFFGTPGIGPNSHFFTIDADECAMVKANPFWTYEGIAFNADRPVDATTARPIAFRCCACTTTAWAGRPTTAT